MRHKRIVTLVLEIPIDVLSWSQAMRTLLQWAQERESRYVAICNVHVTVTAVCKAEFRQVIYGADMALADGAPVAWMLRQRGYRDQLRMSGPDLMKRLLKACSVSGISVYFYGSTETVLAKLHDRIKEQFPDLQVAGMTSPPFRSLSAEEDQADVAKINDSGAGIIFVGLGCPKQEQWMAKHRDHIKGVMIGVGAAFDFHAGTLQRAPQWIRESGFEWLHRLLSEPRRLGMRYFVTNSLFLALAARDFFKTRKQHSLTRNDKKHL